ncbi:hypothetical protein [Vitreimonas flagellata]|uniref:hypothetical protein n=1 Tax=Vitreimonas flagellata TaxID=2560861 RepID=UPI0010754092|nr:hypothetical protein [Vitreimonas flagellata]
MSTMSILVWALIYGVVWNVLGWAGNNFLLEAGWDAVGAQLSPDFAPPWSPLTRELLSFVSDFVYAFAFVWLFAHGAQKSVAHALALVFVLWVSGAVMTYLAIVNAGFLPLEIAVQTSVLALVIFLATAPILPMALAKKA